MKKLLALVMLMGLAGCVTTSHGVAGFDVPDKFIAQARALYDPYTEKAFCLSPTKGVYNVIEGHVMTVKVPWCLKEDAMVHTHPVIARPEPSQQDRELWDKYQARYGTTVFGIMTNSGIRFYKKGE